MQQVLNDYIAVEETRRNYLTAAVDVESKHNLYPIPVTQIELSRTVNESGEESQ